MSIQGLILSISVFAIVGCASTSKVSVSNVTSPSPEPVPVPASTESVTSSTTPTTEVVKKADNGFLICKAKKSRFHYDWSPSSLVAGQNDQNSVRFEFRSANRPAGDKGENLKAGECGWAAEALAGSKKTKSQVTFKSLSDEITQNFYKLKTGKVFKVPVRQTKGGMMTAPGTGISIVR